MWVIEVNVLGRTFTRKVGDTQRAFRFTPQTMQTRLSQLRNSRAAV
jgi:hypothetical protein